MREYQTNTADQNQPVGSLLLQRLPNAAIDSSEGLGMPIPCGSPRSARSILQMQRSYGNRYMQRAMALDRQGEGDGEVTPEIESTIERSRGGGQGLDYGVRRQMESAFGADFSGVRIHTGAEAHQLNRAVSAVAFTTGQDVFFQDGAYNPSNSEGKELLAHELTHVMQQGGSSTISGKAQRVEVQRMCSACEEEKHQNVQRKLAVGRADDQCEKEAEEVARHVARGDSASVVIADQPTSSTGGAGPSRKSYFDHQEDIHPALKQESGPAKLELIPDHPFSDSPLGARRSKINGSVFETVNVREAVISRDGVRRTISLHNRSDAWIARRMNWKNTACKAACWAAGGALAVLVTAACAAGEVFTLGGATIPCAVALGAIGAAVGGAGASICSDLCDNSLANNDAQNAQPVADADEEPVAPAPINADQDVPQEVDV